MGLIEVFVMVIFALILLGFLGWVSWCIEMQSEPVLVIHFFGAV